MTLRGLSCCNALRCSVDLEFMLRGFGQNGCRTHLYATPEVGGTHDDADATEITSSQHVIPNNGEFYLELPWSMVDGQAYCLTTLVWAPGTGAATWANRASAIRLEIPNVLPRYVADDDEQPDHAILCDTLWSWAGKGISVGIYSTDDALDAEVEFSYVLGQDGVFDTGNPVVVGTQSLAPESSAEFTVITPTVTGTTVVKWIATVSSPTGAVPTFTLETGMGVYDLP